ncbi:carbon-nitrogen hydrolase family protein [Phycicoccus avicenniae]|uniref:carbon-nitrogen hydrolase family protein n=1 Tax=Phycicoccus avicenniae TaxID=2828860 RepID=UPI003D2B24A5
MVGAMSATLLLAVAQPEVRKDPRENGVTVRRLMRAAAEGGARMVLFPEGMVSGYAKAQVQSWDDVDFEVVREELEAVAALAVELSIWVILGSAHTLTAPHRPHNSVYVVADDGRVMDRYDKRVLSNTEVTRFYTPGFEPVVFEVDEYRFGIVVCVEINFPDLFIEYEQLGVDCVLLPAYPVDSIFATKARGYAAIHNYWVAMSIPAQSSELFLSALIGPDGQVLAEVDPANELQVVELDPHDPVNHHALTVKRPWRAQARAGQIYRDHQVADPRSDTRTTF